ncbi:MAG: hypothetical protein BWY76_03065 [bacterium ADurb.Bin429]|nr:MAG: hypothetical protein BWY76_03065 [bacterium ADurb.Bin429]
MAIIGVVVLTFDSEGGDARFQREVGGDIVLRGQGVRRAEVALRAAGFQREHQIRGFGGDVQARAQHLPPQRLFALKALADNAQHGHFLRGPLHALAPGGRQRRIFDIVIEHGNLVSR